MVFRVCRRLVLEAVSLTTRGTRAKILPHKRFPRTRPTGCILGLCSEMNYTPYYTLSEITVCMLATQYFARLHGSDHLGSPLSCYPHNYPSEG